ncbi:hypothetical protein [Flavobacterium anhuiense]|uniref:hypothetical protein n=1 Tax=Flavobacterium anhuiense TaxID=459526 RepID=UPI0020271806|nr:hypothetical protein [Flavobacterium anhuiense]URM36136.1 hypothetical protein LLY39_17150 [Flavobacterium anhuiense]
MFAPNYADSDWVKAVVPGTIFNSYVVSGLEKDPNFGDNIYQVDKSKYDRSFWYRSEFAIRKISPKKSSGSILKASIVKEKFTLTEKK